MLTPLAHLSRVYTCLCPLAQPCNLLGRVKRKYPPLSSPGSLCSPLTLSLSPEFPRVVTFLFQPENSPTPLPSTHRLPASLCTWGDLLPLSFWPHVLQPRSQIGPRVPVGAWGGVGAWGPMGVWTPASQPEKCCLDLHFILGSGQDLKKNPLAPY